MTRFLPLCLAIAAVTVQAQTAVSLGPLLSVPVGGMADFYTTGAGGRLVVERPGRRVGWRLAASAARFADREDTPLPEAYRGGVSGGVIGGAVFRVDKALRATAGLGAFHERSGRHAPYVLVPVAEVGLGLSVPAGPVGLDLEVRGQAVLSDLLSGSEYTPSLRVPVSVGVRF